MDMTGRNYEYDHMNFRLNYYELLGFFKDADPSRINPKELPRKKWTKADGIILGRVQDRLIYRESEGEGNLMLFGRPGDGKSTSQAEPTALRFNALSGGGGVICIDIKGSAIIKTSQYRKIKVFDPDNPNKSCHFNPLKDIETLSIKDRIAFIENLSEINIPEEAGDNSKYFVDGARDYYRGIFLYCLSKNITIDFCDIIDEILKHSRNEWEEHISESGVKEAKAYIDQYIGGNEKNLMGMWDKLIKSLRPLQNGGLNQLLDRQGDILTPDVLEKGYDIYLEIPQSKVELYAPMLAIIISQWMRWFMNRDDQSSGEKTTPILFLLDEFPQIPFDFTNLSTALSTLRSKRVSLFLICQSTGQLEKRYGETGMRIIMDNCSYISIMSAQDPKAQKYFSDMIGTRETLKRGISDSFQMGTIQNTSIRNSIGHSIQQTTEPIYQPSSFSHLKKNKVVILSNGRYIEADKCFIFKERNLEKKLKYQ